MELGGGIYRITGDPFPGDFDFDGDVDGDDFLLWQSNFGGDGPVGDADQDGDVDGDDFLLWQSNFGSSLGTTAERRAEMPPRNRRRSRSFASHSWRSVCRAPPRAGNVAAASSRRSTTAAVSPEHSSNLSTPAADP